MLIDFNQMEAMTFPGMNHGSGLMTAKMYRSAQGKVIPCCIHPGGSIGMHRHETSDDLNYVIAGSGKAVTDGVEEILVPGVCHVCKKGSEHAICNTGEDDLVLLTIVVERN